MGLGPALVSGSAQRTAQARALGPVGSCEGPGRVALLPAAPGGSLPSASLLLGVCVCPSLPSPSVLCVLCLSLSASACLPLPVPASVCVSVLPGTRPWAWLDPLRGCSGLVKGVGSVRAPWPRLPQRLRLLCGTQPHARDGNSRAFPPPGVFAVLLPPGLSPSFTRKRFPDAPLPRARGALWHWGPSLEVPLCAGWKGQRAPQPDCVGALA